MIAEMNNPTLDDVLNEMALLPAPPTPSQLRKFLDSYPQFKNDIIDFATSWVEMNALPEAEPATDEEVQLIASRTMSRVRQMMFEESRSEELVDLDADIRDAGHDQVSFEKAVGIDNTILDCLLNRWVDPKSIPARLYAAMASALQRTAQSIERYFLLPPVAAPAYRSKSKPVVRQRAFAEIVEYSTLSDAEKRRWLAEGIDVGSKE